MLNIIERGLVLHLEVEIGTGNFVFKHTLGILKGDSRLNVCSYFCHSLFHVNKVGFLTELLMYILFVGFARQNLLDLIEKRDMMVQHLMHRFERELDHILNVGPLMLLLRY